MAVLIVFPTKDLLTKALDLYPIKNNFHILIIYCPNNGFIGNFKVDFGSLHRLKY